MRNGQRFNLHWNRHSLRFVLIAYYRYYFKIRFRVEGRSDATFFFFHCLPSIEKT